MSRSESDPAAATVPPSLSARTCGGAVRIATLAAGEGQRAVTEVRAALAAVAADGGSGPDADRLRFWHALEQRLVPHAPARSMPAAATTAALLQQPDRIATAALDAALRTLPHRQRQTFLLRVQEDVALADIATILELDDAAARVQLAQALRALRGLLHVGADAVHDGTWLLRCRDLLDAAASAVDIAPLTAASQPSAPTPAATPQRHTVATPAAADSTQRPAATGPTPRSPTQARHPTPATQSTGRSRWLVGAGLLAFAAAAVLLGPRLWPTSVSMPTALPPSAPMPAPPRIAPSEDTPLAAPDFDLLLDAEPDALLDELDFHAWLAAEAADGK